MFCEMSKKSADLQVRDRSNKVVRIKRRLQKGDRIFMFSTRMEVYLRLSNVIIFQSDGGKAYCLYNGRNRALCNSFHSNFELTQEFKEYQL